jgi:hypothetical protein
MRNILDSIFVIVLIVLGYAAFIYLVGFIRY